MNERYVPDPKLIKGDFYAVEETDWLPVNSKGEVLTEDGSVTVGVIFGDWPYYQYNGILVHRAVALTFLECPGNPNNYHVNHKDGVKLNNGRANLEWVSPSENANHAYENGLRNDNRPVLVKNIENNEITRYHSLQACARSFGVNGSLITLYLKNKKNPKQPWRDIWSIIYEGDEWPVIDHSLSKGYAKDIIAVSEANGGKKYIFPSLVAAANFFSINRATIGWYLNRRGSNQTNSYKGYRWYYLNEYLSDINEAIKVGEKGKSPNNLKRRKPKRLKVTDLVTGESVVWDSIWELSKKLGWKKNSLEKAIWRNNGTFQGKKYEYIDNKVLPTSNCGVVSP